MKKNYLEECECCFGEGCFVIFLEATDEYENMAFEVCDSCDGKGQIWVTEKND